MTGDANKHSKGPTIYIQLLDGSLCFSPVPEFFSTDTKIRVFLFLHQNLYYFFKFAFENCRVHLFICLYLSGQGIACFYKIW